MILDNIIFEPQVLLLWWIRTSNILYAFESMLDHILLFKKGIKIVLDEFLILHIQNSIMLWKSNSINSCYSMTWLLFWLSRVIISFTKHFKPNHELTSSLKSIYYILQFMSLYSLLLQKYLYCYGIKLILDIIHNIIVIKIKTLLWCNL